MTRRIAYAIALVASMLLAGCGPGPAAEPPTAAPAVTELGAVEVLEYEGEKLDSSDTFRENSIAGPQYVDVATYELEVSGLVDGPAAYTYSEVTSGFPG